MKKSFVLAAAAAAALLTGCGHNALVYSDGIGVQAGFDPEHLSASFNIRYGKILTVAVRDMVELEMTGDAKGNGSTAETAAVTSETSSGIKMTIGRQLNGAAVDLVEAGATPEHIDALLNKN